MIALPFIHTRGGTGGGAVGGGRGGGHQGLRDRRAGILVVFFGGGGRFFFSICLFVCLSCGAILGIIIEPTDHPPPKKTPLHNTI